MTEQVRRRARPDALVVAVGATIVMQLWRMPSLFPVIAPLRPMILGALGCTAALVLSRRRDRALAAFATPLTAPLLLFVALMIAGIPTSLDPALSTAYLFQEMIPRVLLAVIAVGCVRNRDDLEWLVLATLGGCWIYTLMMTRVAGSGPGGEWVNLVQYDNNDFALLAVASVPLAAYFVRPGEARWRRAFGLATIAMLFFVVAKTASRGGFVGLFIVMLYMAVRYRAISARVRAGAMLAAALAVAVLGGTRYREKLQTFLNPKQDYNWSGQDYNGRLELWKRGLGYMQDRPAFGVGLDAFTVAEGELSEVARARLQHGLEVKTLVAHNMYVQVGAELGIPALLVFLWMLWRTYRTTRAVRRTYSTMGSDDGDLALAFTASLLGYIVCATFIAAGYFTYLYVIVGFVAALAKVAPVASARRVALLQAYAPVPQ